MLMRNPRTCICLWLLLLSFDVAASTWCGKNYKAGDPIVAPKGAFQKPLAAEQPLLAFRCLPRIQPYLESDSCGSASLLIDATVTLSAIQDSHSTSSLDTKSAAPLKVLVEVVGFGQIGVGFVHFNASTEIGLSICGLEARRKPYTVKCTVDTPSPIFYNTKLSYLSDPPRGTVTKLDRKTGALLTRTNRGTFEPIFPIGFFTNFGGYLARNLSILDNLKEQGFNVVHPVPPFEDTEAFTSVLDRMEALGLYLMYDMRHTYQKTSTMAEEVQLIQQRRNLLLWYTADEPDGPNDPPDATQIAYDLISELDGYHPISLALNCDDYYFKDYVAGADIILPDIYHIGNNVSYSTKYGTQCTREFGCCGCDNCRGTFDDIGSRMDDAQDRLIMLGWSRLKHLWAVTQAFGGEEFWSRPPSGREWLVQALVSVMHGARGIIPWIDPMPSGIKQQASALAKILPIISPFLFESKPSLRRHGQVDIAIWTVKKTCLLIGTNLADRPSTINIYGINTVVLSEGVRFSDSALLEFDGFGSVILFIRHSTSDVLRDEL